jgi:transcriptional regulator with PAS, ATPase and Fis domain
VIGNINIDNFSSIGAVPESILGLTSPAQSMQQIADAVAAAMGVDVTIANDSLLRVAGTGPFEADLGEKVPQGGVLTFSDLESTHKDTFRAIEHGTAFTFDDIIGTSHAITQVKQHALTASKYDSNILLTGETGTGKGLFARAIHNASPRRDYPFVAVNCTAIPESLLESELFGYEAGAFTGASKNGKPGKFELANHGTLFLDEIGDMPLFLQAKLLRATQNMEITRVGGLYPKRIDARIISATNQDLEEHIRTHRFRDDLYYRLCVVPISLPPLKQRLDDIPVLADYFITRYAHQFNKVVSGLTDDALDLLMEYDWPGNARELENVIEYAVNVFLQDPSLLMQGAAGTIVFRFVMVALSAVAFGGAVTGWLGSSLNWLGRLVLFAAFGLIISPEITTTLGVFALLVGVWAFRRLLAGKGPVKTKVA